MSLILASCLNAFDIWERSESFRRRPLNLASSNSMGRQDKARCRRCSFIFGFGIPSLKRSERIKRWTHSLMVPSLNRRLKLMFRKDVQPGYGLSSVPMEQMLPSSVLAFGFGQRSANKSLSFCESLIQGVPSSYAGPFGPGTLRAESSYKNALRSY